MLNLEVGLERFSLAAKGGGGAAAAADSFPSKLFSTIFSRRKMPGVLAELKRI
jgi:hypothetical protein